MSKVRVFLTSGKCMKSDKQLGYNVMIKHTFFLPGQPRKREPVVTVRTKEEASIIAFRLNGRSRSEELYIVEKVVG